MILRARQVGAKLLERLLAHTTSTSEHAVTTPEAPLSMDGHSFNHQILRTLAAVGLYERRALFRRQQGLKELLCG
jgi:hypothetical protein